MAQVNGGGSSTSKAPAPGYESAPKMDVQPPKQEDLQQSYATLIGNDPNPKGWYGSMSTSPAIYNALHRSWACIVKLTCLI